MIFYEIKTEPICTIVIIILLHTVVVLVKMIYFIYNSTFTISKLLGLVCEQTILIFVQENSVYSINLENLVVTFLLEYNTSRIEC